MRETCLDWCSKNQLWFVFKVVIEVEFDLSESRDGESQDKVVDASFRLIAEVHPRGG